MFIPETDENSPPTDVQGIKHEEIKACYEKYAGIINKDSFSNDGQCCDSSHKYTHGDLFTDDKIKKCEPYNPYIKVTSLAQAYIPNQQMCSLYSPTKALLKGTAFPELNKPYHCMGKTAV